MALCGVCVGSIFNKEKEQSRLKQAQLIGEIGSQAMDVIRTQGEIAGLKAQTDPGALSQAREQLTKDGKPASNADVMQRAYNNAMQQYGTGSDLQKAAQAVTGTLTALAGNNLAGALASGASPYLATEIKKLTTTDGQVNVAANAMAHAVLGAVTAQLNNQSAVAGGLGAGGGELAARYIAGQLFPDKTADQLSESEKQQVSALSQLASGLAGGLTTGDAGGAVTAAQAGKNAVENNFLSSTSTEKRDVLAEKVLKGDKSLQTAKEFLQLENADKRSDALVAKFNKEPAKLTTAERTELVSYLKIYASDMQAKYGEAVTKELIAGMLTGQDYMKSAPQTEAQQKAQTIMSTWGYHKSNASIGDPVLLFGSTVLGTTIKEGMALNAAIGVGVNTGVQLSGNDPFSYVDAILAGVTAAATTGKSWQASAAIKMGGAAIGSAIKGEDPTNSTLGAGFGSVAGGVAGKVASEVMKPVVKETASDVAEAAIGSLTSEVAGNKVKDQLDHHEGEK